jgi:energy-coupling factor transporter ATP-binding protein EcfA2
VGFRYASRIAPALRDVSFDVEPGECLLVVGPSGGGKSTLALALGGLIPGDFAGSWDGELEVAGLDTRRAARAAIAERVGLVFQEPASQIVMEWTDDEVAFGLENRGWPLANMRARVPEALDEVGLLGLGRRRSRTLSGGQQQRLALAGVLAPSPAVLVLDEPTSNLDPAGAAAFLDRLSGIVRARTTTVVLVEHRVDAAWPLADRVLALDADGQAIAFDSPAQVLAVHGGRLRAAGIWLPGDARRPRSDAGVRPAPGGVQPLVLASGVSFSYDGRAPVIDRADLTICPGERLAVLGRNGSGKTTLAKLMVGLLRPGSGRVVLAGDPPHRLPAAVLATRAGYVFQDPELQFVTDRVRDEIAVGLAAADRVRAEHLLETLGLPLGRLGDASPYSLSGGEKRRLSVACCLVRRPALLVLDEPTFGQDRGGFAALVALLHERVAEGTAIVSVTHDLGFAAQMADRAAVLDRGRVAWDGPCGPLVDDATALRHLGLAA